MSSLRFYIFLVTCVALFITSCDSGTDPVSTALPRGNWYHVLESNAGNPSTRTHSRITLGNDTASIVDTFFTVTNDISAIDSIRYIELELNGVGDGYYRAFEIHTAPDLTPTDTTLHYWYFFVRNNLLYYYTGMRFEGGQSGIVGSWSNASYDNSLLGEQTNMTFTPDSVMIVREALDGTTVFSKNYSYETDKDTLRIAGSDVPYYGQRYEIVPGLALYITSHATRGYAPLEE